MANPNYKNYKAMSNQPKKEHKKPEVVEKVMLEPEVVEVVEEVEEVTPEVAREPDKLVGVVNCTLLNVREAATKASKVLCEINKDTKVTIESEANDEWYEVTTKNGIKGYCMKEFITI